MNKIKICYVTCALEVGGAEKFLYDLIKHLDKSRFDPLLATVIGGGVLEKDFRALGIPMHIFGQRRWRYVSGLAQIVRLYFLFRREKPQIVHTQLFGADLCGRLAAWLARVPIIITTEQNINCDQSWLREILKAWTYRLTRHSVAISSAVKRYMVHHYGVPKDKITVIPNDVDVEKMEKEIIAARQFYHSREACPRPESGNENIVKKIILTVGRLAEQKGQKYLLEAMAKLPERENYELWIVGEGPLRPALEKQARDLGIVGQVKFLGLRHDVSTLLGQADLFVFPSLWEGLGIAVLEAALARVPIVASAVGGILDIIKNNETGYLAEPGDSDELVFAMEKVFVNPNRARYMVERAYRYVKEKFDIKDVAQKYEELYLYVIASETPACHRLAEGMAGRKQSRPL